MKHNGEVINEKSIEVMHKETWESPFTFRATRAGEDQKLEFLLHKEGLKEPEPYRSLHLWVDVQQRIKNLKTFKCNEQCL